jgi:hypothetical protein
MSDNLIRLAVRPRPRPVPSGPQVRHYGGEPHDHEAALARALPATREAVARTRGADAGGDGNG